MFLTGQTRLGTLKLYDCFITTWAHGQKDNKVQRIGTQEPAGLQHLIFNLWCRIDTYYISGYPCLKNSLTSRNMYGLTRGSMVLRSLILLPLRLRWVRLGHFSASTSRPPEILLSLSSSYYKHTHNRLY